MESEWTSKKEKEKSRPAGPAWAPSRHTMPFKRDLLPPSNASRGLDFWRTADRKSRKKKGVWYCCCRWTSGVGARGQTAAACHLILSFLFFHHQVFFSYVNFCLVGAFNILIRGLFSISGHRFSIWNFHDCLSALFLLRRRMRLLFRDPRCNLLIDPFIR